MDSEFNTKQINIEKANGKHEAFDEEKLRSSLLRSGATSEEVEEVFGHIVAELFDGMTTTEIYKHAFSLLHATTKPVATIAAEVKIAVRYSWALISAAVAMPVISVQVIQDTRFGFVRCLMISRIYGTTE